MRRSSSPLAGKYLVRNRLARRLLASVDFCLGPLAPWKFLPIAPPRRILLANGAHLGDVLLSTAVLPVLRQAFPEAKIGFLIGSWSRPVLEGHPLVDVIHHVDHWKLNRAAIPLRQKLRHYRATRAAALREIRSQHYDVALDLYFFFPNCIPLLWNAGIPVRIGYTSGGFGPLLTHAFDWTLRDCHVTEYQRALLELLPLGSAGATMSCMQPPTLTLPHKGGGNQKSPPPLWGRVRVGGDDYLVLHPGAGSVVKEWPRDRWIELVQRLQADGHRLLFTGSEAERARVSEIVPDGGVNLCGELDWPEFVAVVRGARLLVGVDSVAGHVAAAVGTPCVVVSTGITHPAHWRPLGRHCRVLTHPVACSPCYRQHGCATMDCIRQVAVEPVHAAARELLAASVSPCSMK